MNGRTKELEDELSGEMQAQTNAMSVEAGRDVTTDLTSWQSQALEQNQKFFIRQGFRRRHPFSTLGQYSSALSNGNNPRMGWEKAFEQESERSSLPQVYKKHSHEMLANQMGLAITAAKNYEKSRSKLGVINAVGV